MNALRKLLPPSWLLLVIASLLFAPLISAQSTSPPLPQLTFKPKLVNGVGKWHLGFDCAHGFKYEVQQSTDSMKTWSPLPNGTFYGRGQHEECYVFDGPMTSDSSSSNGGGWQEDGQSWHLINLSLKLQLSSTGTVSTSRLSRAAYTPPGGGPQIPAWDAILTEPFPLQTPGTRYFPMLEWTDASNMNMYWLDVNVETTQNPAPPDSISQWSYSGRT